MYDQRDNASLSASCYSLLYNHHPSAVFPAWILGYRSRFQNAQHMHGRQFAKLLAFVNAVKGVWRYERIREREPPPYFTQSLVCPKIRPPNRPHDNWFLVTHPHNSHSDERLTLIHHGRLITGYQPPSKLNFRRLSPSAYFTLPPTCLLKTDFLPKMLGYWQQKSY